MYSLAIYYMMGSVVERPSRAELTIGRLGVKL